MSILDRIFGTSRNSRTQINEDQFHWEQIGYEKGFQAAMSNKIEGSSELQEWEREAVIEFLVSRNLELCYDISINGFRIRKRNYGKAHLKIREDQ